MTSADDEPPGSPPPTSRTNRRGGGAGVRLVILVSVLAACGAVVTGRVRSAGVVGYVAAGGAAVAEVEMRLEEAAAERVQLAVNLLKDSADIRRITS